MGWFKSAEEKEAEKQKNELVEKYGEEDGLRIFEEYNSEEKYLEEKEKKKAAEELIFNEKAPQKVLDYFEETGSISFDLRFFEDNVSKDSYEDAMRIELLNYYPSTTTVSIESPENIVKEFIRLAKELIEEGKLFKTDTWKGESNLYDVMEEEILKDIKECKGRVFTKSYAEECIAKYKEEQYDVKSNELLGL